MFHVFWYCNASIFFSQILPFGTPWPPTSTKFFCVRYWKYSIVILNMYVLSKISHTFKPNQAPNVASIVGYIISRMSRPYCKVLCSCTSTQMPKMFIWNTSLEIISHHLPWTNFRTQFHLVLLTKSWLNLLVIEQPLLLKWDLHIKRYLITLILKMTISRLLYANYLVY